MISLPSLSVALSLLFLLPVAFSNDSGLPSFSSSSSQVSNGKNARCEVGTLNVNVEAQNVKLVYDGPANQTILTATFNDLLAAGSTLGVTVQGGPSTVRDTYAINAQLCFPASANPDNVKTVQLLTHGGSLNSLYWDLQQNSYVDAATVAGYATLAYDRLGAGKSERPDPVQVVQASVEVEISHLLTQALRNGAIDGKHNFNRVIGTSHSSGNILTIGQAVKYPNDFDASVFSKALHNLLRIACADIFSTSLVVTGFTINGNYMPPTLAAGAYEPAAASGDPRFAGLPNGYYVQATPQSIQFLFFKFPNYDQKSLSSLKIPPPPRHKQSIIN